MIHRGQDCILVMPEMAKLPAGVPVILIVKKPIGRMEAQNFQLQAVKERFPMQEKDIINLYYHDLEFRAICEDYYLCMFYLSKFRKETSETEQSVEEYEKMKQELESELLDRLKAAM